MLEEYIPFKEKKFRPYQKETLLKIIDAIDNDCKNIILEAPVGLGKSLMGYVLARYYQDLDAPSYVYTKTKYLQDQYLKDFKDMVTVKGRNNFQCMSDPFFTCDKGACKQIANFYCLYKPELTEAMELDQNYCPYWKQKLNGIAAPITLLNYTYAFTDSLYIQHFGRRYLGICDEGHNIEKELMGLLETKLSVKQIKKDIGVTIPSKSYQLTLKEWVDLLYTIAGRYKDLAADTDDLLKKDKYSERHVSLKQTATLIDEKMDNWVVKDESFKGYKSIIFKPIMVDGYTNLLFDKARYNVIMSGSILKPNLFAKELGLEEYKYIEIPSIIPPENRPIIKAYCGSMSSRNFDDNKLLLKRKIQYLADRHYNDKGIIHTFTYKIARELQKELGQDSRYIFHDNTGTQFAIDKFKENKGNAILVSPVAYEGVDFPYDEARWQIICKDPFPNIGDKQVAARDNIDFGWVFRQRCLVLSQMYGRSNRAVDDYSVTYLLDSNLENLLGPSTLVTDYFLEGLVGLDYARPFELAPNAYNKLSPDKRRSYEQERYEETCILNAIRDEGLNTLEKIRKEYKTTCTDNSYQYVMPIVDRLHKNGAIRYIE